MSLLPRSTQAQLRLMSEEGCGIRQAERALGVHRDTIMRYRKAWGLPQPPRGDPGAREARRQWAAQNPRKPADPKQARLLQELAAAVAEINTDAEPPPAVHEEAAPPRKMPAPRRDLFAVQPPLCMLLHTFYLRRGVPFQVSLPEDFRREEAERLFRLLQVLAVPEKPAT